MDVESGEGEVSVNILPATADNTFNPPPFISPLCQDIDSTSQKTIQVIIVVPLFQDITKSNKNLLPLLFPRYWLHFPENHQNRSPTFPEKFRKIVFPFSVLIQNLSSENDLNFQGNWTPFSVNVIFFFVWTANEFTRVLIKSEANPPPPSDGSHEYSRSFKTAQHSWENLTPQQVSPKRSLF